MKAKASEVLKALAESLASAAAELEAAPDDSGEFYDQHSAPLPSRTFLKLVRSGVFQGYSVHRRILVRKAEVHAYIEAHPWQPRKVRDVREQNEYATDQDMAIELDRLNGYANRRRAG